MQTIWIVAAGNSRARIFEVHGAQDHLHEIEDFAHPAGRAGPSDIATDELGNFYGKDERNAAHAAEPNLDPAEYEIELFSKRVSEFLDQARIEHRYDKLCLIAFPKLLGMMRQNLSKEARQLVGDEVPKDISRLDAREIEDYLRNKLH